jgi:hypothetical protein
MTRAWISALLILLGRSAGAAGEIPISAENLLFSPPKDFEVGYQSIYGNQSMTEMVPRGETVDNWTPMLTVQIFRGATVDSATFLQGLGKRYMNDCPGTRAKGIFTGKTNGYDVSMLVLKCPKNPATDKPETTAFRVIKGNDALYSVQRAWRADPSDEEIDGVMHFLAKVTVCDTRTADHPCPSLDSWVSPLKDKVQ